MHNMALLRLRTCIKFCANPEDQNELIDGTSQSLSTIQEFQEKRNQRITQALQVLEQKNQERCGKALQSIFRASDFAHNDYLVEGESLQDFSEDLQKLIKEIQSKFSEKRHGSERSQALIANLLKIVPELYRKMMRTYKKQEKSFQRRQKKSNKEKEDKILAEVHDLEMQLQKMEDWTYVSTDEDDKSDDYSDEERKEKKP